MDDETEFKVKTVGYKFSQDVFISPYLLDKWGVKYTDNDLEKTPWGKVLRLKDKNAKEDT